MSRWMRALGLQVLWMAAVSVLAASEWAFRRFVWQGASELFCAVCFAAADLLLLSPLRLWVCRRLRRSGTATKTALRRWGAAVRWRAGVWARRTRRLALCLLPAAGMLTLYQTMAAWLPSADILCAFLRLCVWVLMAVGCAFFGARCVTERISLP